MKKIFEKLVDLGRIIAIFAMISPIIILNSEVWNSDNIFLLICSILYDIYMYDLISNYK